MRPRLVAGVVACALAALAWVTPQVRRTLLFDVTHWDAVPAEPAAFPGGAGIERPGSGAGLAPAPRTRVVVIDGLSAEVATTLPTLAALCARGVSATVDVGFPTVSLPVEVALWSGLTQQQTGVVNRYERPLEPPLIGIPSQVAGSWAVAEDHGWIVRSLGFARVEPAADPRDHVKDADPKAWFEVWQDHAVTAVASPARLVFVHILRVDTAGHQHGGDSPAYRAAAQAADTLLARLIAADADARWFVVSDHGHLPRGGHGGEERAIRQVTGCVAGPGVALGHGPRIHIVDLARAIADSTAAPLPAGARGRPLAAAIATPLGPDDAVPAIALGPGAVAFLVLAAGIALTVLAARRWWLAPWWFVAACVALVVIRGEPTLSAPYIYKPAGRDMYLVWLPMIAFAFGVTMLGVRRQPLVRVAAAQLALPLTAAAAALTASGAWPAVFGAEIAPVVPRFTAYASPLLLMASHGAAAVALAALATLVRLVFGRRGRPAPP
jgi:Type I phosphodiesterase / nucleotide pyrophosphatase